MKALSYRTRLCAGLSLLALALAWAGVAAERQQLFNGHDVTGWHSPTGDWQSAKSVAIDPVATNKFVITPGDGILVNGPKGRTVDLLSTAEFGDVEVHIEFCIPAKSNSGIYFMGRYELQVYDSFGVEKDLYPGIECGGLYPRWDDAKQHEYEGHSPRVNVSKPPGQWQTFDVVFRAPRFDASGHKTANAKFVKVVHNGQVIHENIEITGPTRSAHWTDERPAGPLLLQGDHGPVAYRNLWIQPIKTN